MKNIISILLLSGLLTGCCCRHHCCHDHDEVIKNMRQEYVTK